MTSAHREMSGAEADSLLASLSKRQASGVEVADLEFPPGMNWKAADARGIIFRNLEWTHGSIAGRLLGRGRMQECRFERVNLDDFRCRKVDFLDCHFEKVTFGEHFLGLIKDCTFTRCSFVKCRFDAVEFLESTLRSCRFEGATAERAAWNECLLEDVVLSGTLVKTNFISSAFRKVDLSEAELHDSSLVYTKEGDVMLPDRPDNFAMNAQLFLDAEPALRSKLDPAAHETYRTLANGWSQLGSPFIVDAAGVVEELPPRDRAAVMATLYEMRRHRPIWIGGASPVP